VTKAPILLIHIGHASPHPGDAEVRKSRMVDGTITTAPVRNYEAFQLRQKGLTFAQIAEEYGVSTERARQYVVKHEQGAQFPRYVERLEEAWREQVRR